MLGTENVIMEVSYPLLARDGGVKVRLGRIKVTSFAISSKKPDTCRSGSCARPQAPWLLSPVWRVYEGSAGAATGASGVVERV